MDGFTVFVLWRKQRMKARELAEAHWDSYVKKIVEAHESDPSVVEKVGVHYVLTFIHGYKHGVEDAEKM